MDPKTLFKLSYGLYIVGSKKGNLINGQTANTVFQITSDPVTLAISINKQNLSHEYIKESNVFTVSILAAEAPLSIVGNFGFQSGRQGDKFKDIKWKKGLNGVPVVLDGSVGYFEAEVVDSMDIGTHTIFIGRVTESEITADGLPMTYALYHERKNAAKAPTPSIKPGMEKYECTVCGYIYDPVQGDPDSGIKPGTPFEDIPDDWVCPICGVTKDQFQKVV